MIFFFKSHNTMFLDPMASRVSWTARLVTGVWSWGWEMVEMLESADPSCRM